MPFVAVPDKNAGDTFTQSMWSQYVEGNLNAGVDRPLWDSGTLGAPAGSVDILSIPATFAHLLVVLSGRGDAAVQSEFVGIRFNNDATANYDSGWGNFAGTATAAAESLTATSGIAATIPAASAATNWFGGGSILIPNYASATGTRSWVGISTARYNTTATTGPIYLVGGTYRIVAAVNRVTLIPQSGGNFIAGTRVTVYGLGYI